MAFQYEKQGQIDSLEAQINSMKGLLANVETSLASAGLAPAEIQMFLVRSGDLHGKLANLEGQKATLESEKMRKEAEDKTRNDVEAIHSGNFASEYKRLKTEADRVGVGNLLDSKINEVVDQLWAQAVENDRKNNSTSERGRLISTWKGIPELPVRFYKSREDELKRDSERDMNAVKEMVSDLAKRGEKDWSKVRTAIEKKYPGFDISTNETMLQKEFDTLKAEVVSIKDEADYDGNIAQTVDKLIKDAFATNKVAELLADLPNILETQIGALLTVGERKNWSQERRDAVKEKIEKDIRARIEGTENAEVQRLKLEADVKEMEWKETKRKWKRRGIYIKYAPVAIGLGAGAFVLGGAPAVAVYSLLGATGIASVDRVAGNVTGRNQREAADTRELELKKTQLENQRDNVINLQARRAERLQRRQIREIMVAAVNEATYKMTPEEVVNYYDDLAKRVDSIPQVNYNIDTLATAA